MIPTAAMRRLSTWLVGLFLIAQVFGVVPVLSEHTAHIAATELLPSQVSASTGNIPQGCHHRGDHDIGPSRTRAEHSSRCQQDRQIAEHVVAGANPC